MPSFATLSRPYFGPVFLTSTHPRRALHPPCPGPQLRPIRLPPSLTSATATRPLSHSRLATAHASPAPRPLASRKNSWPITLPKTPPRALSALSGAAGVLTAPTSSPRVISRTCAWQTEFGHRQLVEHAQTQPLAEVHSTMGVSGLVLMGLLPTLANWPLSFETDQDLRLLQPSGLAVFERVQQHASDGQWALHVVFPGAPQDTWPGFSVPPPQPDLSAGPVLRFEAYNPSDQPAPLACRVDDQEGKVYFESLSIPPRSRTTVEIWTKPLRGTLNLARLSRFYIYISRPRQDWELFFDRFRFEAAGEMFRRVEHQPSHPPTGLEAPGPAFIVFQRPWMEHVFATDWPTPEEQVTRLSVAAAQGEYEPLTLSLAARRDLSSLKATLTDFTGAGSRLPARTAEIRVVRSLDKRWTYSDPQRRYLAALPVLLEPQPAEGLRLPAGQVATFWLTFYVPPRTRPGLYTATLTLQAAAPQTVSLSLPLQLRVYPFALPEVTDKLWGVYYTGPREFEEGSDLEKLERHLRDMRAHGMTSVGLCFGWDPAQTDVAHQRVDFLPAGRGRYETFMGLYHKLGFPAPVLQLADTPQDALSSKLAIGSQEFAQTYANIWKFVQSYGRAHQWPEIIVQPVDEPAWQSKDAQERNRLLLEALKRWAPEIRTEQDGPGDDYFHRVAGPLADLWNYNGSLADPTTIRQAKAQGKLILIYNCDVEWYRPIVDRYVAGWFQVLAGIDGCFNWAYQSFHGDPYDDQDARFGDHLAYYPPGRGHPGGPSTAWEAFREGIDDYRYFALLQSLIKKARQSRRAAAAQLADQAAAQLQQLIASLKYSPQVRGTAEWEKSWEAEGKLYISGRLCLPNGWLAADYDRARQKMADLALRLLELTSP
jgi:hypothetical protein